MEGDDKPLDNFKRQLEDLRREMQEQIAALKEKDKYLEGRQDAVSRMIEDGKHH